MNGYRVSVSGTGLLLVLLAITGAAAQQGDEKEQTAPADAWKALKFFEGSWEGTGGGNSGTSRVEVHYEYVLQDKFLYARTKAVFEPQEKNPKGEIHEDWGMFSFDRKRRMPVLRQFHVEGFVNQYVLDSISQDGKSIVFSTEQVENGPPGLRARITLTILADDEYTEAFELAFAGKEFAPCSTTHLKRKK